MWRAEHIWHTGVCGQFLSVPLHWVSDSTCVMKTIPSQGGAGFPLLPLHGFELTGFSLKFPKSCRLSPLLTLNPKLEGGSYDLQILKHCDSWLGDVSFWNNSRGNCLHMNMFQSTFCPMLVLRGPHQEKPSVVRYIFKALVPSLLEKGLERSWTKNLLDFISHNVSAIYFITDLLLISWTPWS